MQSRTLQSQGMPISWNMGCCPPCYIILKGEDKSYKTAVTSVSDFHDSYTGTCLVCFQPLIPAHFKGVECAEEQ